jgi:TolA-binding protein
MLTTPDRSGAQSQLPDWVPWLQVGLTSMLVVLFVVLVGKTRQQQSQLQELQERVRGLENSRALERTTALEQQLRSTVDRLQSLERGQARLNAIGSDTAQLRQELRQLRQLRQSSEEKNVQPARPPASTPQSPPPLPPLTP